MKRCYGWRGRLQSHRRLGRLRTENCIWDKRNNPVGCKADSLIFIFIESVRFIEYNIVGAFNIMEGTI